MEDTGDINSDGMKYEATPMGERITQLCLDPVSISNSDRPQAGCQKASQSIGPVTNFGLLHLATATPDSSLWAKNSEMDIIPNYG